MQGVRLSQSITECDDRCYKNCSLLQFKYDNTLKSSMLAVWYFHGCWSPSCLSSNSSATYIQICRVPCSSYNGVAWHRTPQWSPPFSVIKLSPPLSFTMAVATWWLCKYDHAIVVFGSSRKARCTQWFISSFSNTLLLYIVACIAKTFFDSAGNIAASFLFVIGEFGGWGTSIQPRWWNSSPSLIENCSSTCGPTLSIW